jgi:hypothetical protein
MHTIHKQTKHAQSKEEGPQAFSSSARAQIIQLYKYSILNTALSVVSCQRLALPNFDSLATTRTAVVSIGKHTAPSLLMFTFTVQAPSGRTTDWCCRRSIKLMNNKQADCIQCSLV